MRLFLALLVAAFAVTGSALDLVNLDEAHYCAGRRLRPEHLYGKTVLIVRWGANCPSSRQMLRNLEQIWKGFKEKPFLIIASHYPDWGERESIEPMARANGATFAVYENVMLAKDEPEIRSLPSFSVYDSTGKCAYYGHDDRAMLQAVVTTLTDYDVPRDVAQWRRLLDYEIKHQPAHAALRLEAFRKEFPNDESLAGYEQRVKEFGYRKDFSRLVELVRVTRSSGEAVTERRLNLAEVSSAIERYADLIGLSNDLLAREARCALDELKWLKN